MKAISLKELTLNRNSYDFGISPGVLNNCDQVRYTTMVMAKQGFHCTKKWSWGLVRIMLLRGQYTLDVRTTWPVMLECTLEPANEIVDAPFSRTSNNWSSRCIVWLAWVRHHVQTDVPISPTSPTLLNVFTISADKKITSTSLHLDRADHLSYIETRAVLYLVCALCVNLIRDVLRLIF